MLLKIFSKNSDEYLILAHPTEQCKIGDYLIISDQNSDLVIQVFDQTYLDCFGTAEEIVREQAMFSDVKGVDYDDFNLQSFSNIIKDMKILKCKSRGYLSGKNNKITIPSRVHSQIRKCTLNEIFDSVDDVGKRQFSLGKYDDLEDLKIYAEHLDGSLNIITGKKGSGKSHISKLLVSQLAEYGANIIVFDLNNEYWGLKDKYNSSNLNDPNVKILLPGNNLQFNLKYLGLQPFIHILKYVLDIPAASLREFVRIWNKLSEKNSLNMYNLNNEINYLRGNEFVKEALMSRFSTIKHSNLFTDVEENAVTFENLFDINNNGTINIISLGKVSSSVRRMTVELILSKLTHLLERDIIPPIFLFAEEAHLYLRETYWDDIITRMRHFGIFPTFITNQPDAIKDGIYRQADNIFLFNFTSDLDLDMISRASTTDSLSIKSIVKNLDRGSCLVLGKVVHDFPVLIKTKKSEFNSLGQTKLFFKDDVLDETEKIIPEIKK